MSKITDRHTEHNVRRPPLTCSATPVSCRLAVQALVWVSSRPDFTSPDAPRTLRRRAGVTGLRHGEKGPATNAFRRPLPPGRNTMLAGLRLANARGERRGSPPSSLLDRERARGRSPMPRDLRMWERIRVGLPPVTNFRPPSGSRLSVPDEAFYSCPGVSCGSCCSTTSPSRARISSSVFCVKSSYYMPTE